MCGKGPAATDNKSLELVHLYVFLEGRKEKNRSKRRTSEGWAAGDTSKEYWLTMCKQNSGKKQTLNTKKQTLNTKKQTRASAQACRFVIACRWAKPTPVYSRQTCREFDVEVSRVLRTARLYLPDVVVCQVNQPRRVCAKEFSDAVPFYKVLVPWVSVPETHVWRDGGEEVLQRHWLNYVAQVAWGTYSEERRRTGTEEVSGTGCYTSTLVFCLRPVCKFERHVP